MKLAADWTLLPSGLRGGVSVEVEGGRIAAVHETVSKDATRLPRRVLLPGFVDAHAHSFQRALRGRTQRGGGDDTFWTWRERMYALAERLGPDELHAICRFSFVERLLAGTTSVGEFFYLVNDPEGRRYADENELARRVIGAAAEAGTRLALLVVAYARGGTDRPAEGAQRRYVDPDVDAYLARALSLAKTTKVGLAPHSVRAVPREWLARIAAAAGERVVHAHVAEQRAEVDACIAEHGRRPVEVLADAGLLGERFTAVHATHLGPGEAEILGAARATACLCPTTERDLGDGLPDAGALETAGAALALGTDGQTGASLLDEARGVEMNERVRTERRIVLGHSDPARAAIRWATSAGARSLDLGVGAIAAGLHADFVALDLDDPSLAGAADDPDALLGAIAFSSDSRAVRDVWVEGERVVTDGRHAAMESARADFERAMRTIWGTTAER